MGRRSGNNLLLYTPLASWSGPGSPSGTSKSVSEWEYPFRLWISRFVSGIPVRLPSSMRSRGSIAMYPIARPLPGTRFRLFPQSPETGLFSEPETVIIALPPGSIGPGPCDDRMYVADAIGKLVPYGEGIWRSAPPWPGLDRPPVAPGPDGNFDHIPVDSPDFLPVHMYGVARLVLQIWESYLG